MARRYRKVRSRRRRSRRRFRRRSAAGKALRRVRSLSRKIAGEVKKLDVNAIIPEDAFTQITSAVGTAADNASSLPDFAYVYKVFISGNVQQNSIQGLDLGDFIGEQVRAKYLYVGIHLQMPVRPSDTSSSPATVQQPVCVRCIILQDRNYNVSFTTSQIVQNLFGLNPASTASGTYLANADYTLLPYNPQEPGRFNIMRDFKMYVAPGWRQDYYKKVMLLQKDMLSGGRFYAGNSSMNAADNPPGQSASNWTSMRNNIYILFLYQSPTLYGVNQTGTPDFTISVQTRLAYYDN